VYYVRIKPIRIDIDGKAIYRGGKTFFGETGWVDGTTGMHVRRPLHGKNKMDKKGYY